jgi:ribosome maturation factor RimP
MNPNQQAIENFLNDLIEGNDDLFLVELLVSPANDIKVFLDSDKGITIDKCIRINRALYRRIEEELFPDGNFSLEVSSPGVDEPLKLKRQYKKNVGRMVEVLMNDNARKEGKLVEADEDHIVIEESEGKGKKAVHKKTTILFNQIKHTKVLVTF